jgi:hypothetical protein
MSEGSRFPRPTPNAVVGRALVLTVLQMRLTQEATVRVGDLAQQEEARSMAGALAGFGPMFKGKNIISSEETKLFDSTLGNWSDQEAINVDWRGECIGVLGWALGLEPNILPYDQKFHVDPKKYMDALLGLIKNNNAGLKSNAEIDKEREIAQMWNWRCRTTRLQKEGHMLPEGVTFDQIISFSASAYYKDGLLAPPLSNDFQIFNKAFGEMTEGEYHHATSIASERHYALNWLCGYAENWDEVPTET